MASRHVRFVTRCAKCILHNARQWVFNKLTQEVGETLSYFVIALLSPNVSSRFLKVHNCGEMWAQKLFIDKVRSNVSPAFESKLICFPPSSSSSSSPRFVILFPLCFSDWEFFLLFLISFTHRCSGTRSQLIITTSLHSEKSLTHPGGFPPPVCSAGFYSPRPLHLRHRWRRRSVASTRFPLGTPTAS